MNRERSIRSIGCQRLVCLSRWTPPSIDGYVYGRFYPSDTVLSNMKVLMEYIKRRALFMAFYVDRATHFKATRRP